MHALTSTESAHLAQSPNKQVHTPAVCVGGPVHGVYVSIHCVCNAISVTLRLCDACRCRTRDRRPSVGSCAPTGVRLQCECSGQALSWGCARCGSHRYTNLLATEQLPSYTCNVSSQCIAALNTLHCTQSQPAPPHGDTISRPDMYWSWQSGPYRRGCFWLSGSCCHCLTQICSNKGATSPHKCGPHRHLLIDSGFLHCSWQSTAHRTGCSPTDTRQTSPTR